jgi:hypothetical protein
MSLGDLHLQAGAHQQVICGLGNTLFCVTRLASWVKIKYHSKRARQLNCANLFICSNMPSSELADREEKQEHSNKKNHTFLFKSLLF